MDTKPAINTDRIDEAVLALLYLGICDTRGGMVRTWKSFDWEAMDRLHEKGLISDPASKARASGAWPISSSLDPSHSVARLRSAFKQVAIFRYLDGCHDRSPSTEPTTLSQ
jgi:hypothetical protein